MKNSLSYCRATSASTAHALRVVLFTVPRVTPAYVFMNIYLYASIYVCVCVCMYVYRQIDTDVDRYRYRYR